MLPPNEHGWQANLPPLRKSPHPIMLDSAVPATRVYDLMSFLRCEVSLPDPGLDNAVRAIVCQSAK
jgi:hypothetical protein